MNAARRTLLFVLTAAGISGTFAAADLSDLPGPTGQMTMYSGALVARETQEDSLTQRLAAQAVAAQVAAAQVAAAQVAAAQQVQLLAAEQASAERASRSRAISDAATPVSTRQYARSLLAARGQGDQFGCLTQLWDRESGWSSTSTNATSGAYGIPQALPPAKMASAGADWRTNAATQVRWGIEYIASRYGGPCTALQHSLGSGWY